MVRDRCCGIIADRIPRFGPWPARTWKCSHEHNDRESAHRDHTESLRWQASNCRKSHHGCEHQCAESKALIGSPWKKNIPRLDGNFRNKPATAINRAKLMSSGDLSWITNYIWGIADDVLRDLYMRGKYRDVILRACCGRRRSGTARS